MRWCLVTTCTGTSGRCTTEADFFITCHRSSPRWVEVALRFITSSSTLSGSAKAWTVAPGHRPYLGAQAVERRTEKHSTYYLDSAWMFYALTKLGMRVAPHLAPHWSALEGELEKASGEGAQEGGGGEAGCHHPPPPTAATRYEVAAREGEEEVGAREVVVVASTSSDLLEPEGLVQEEVEDEEWKEKEEPSLEVGRGRRRRRGRSGSAPGTPRWRSAPPHPGWWCGEEGCGAGLPP